MTNIEYSKFYPIVSVVVPVYNDHDGIKDTLDSLVIQNYPNTYEIIVADNGSTDSTVDIVKYYKTKYPDGIKLVYENNIQSSYAARNKALSKAKGSIIAFIDSNMHVDNNWLLEIVTTIREKDIDYLGCKVEIYSNHNSIFSLYDIITGFPIEEYINNRNFAPTCCLAVKKQIFNQVGYFNERLISSGDYEFGTRVYNAGFKLGYNPNIIMKHPARTTLVDLLKKSFRIGRGFYQVAKHNPEAHKKLKSGFLYSLLMYNRSWDLFIFNKNKVEWKQMSITKKIILYLLSIMCKIVKALGYLYEKYNKNLYTNF